MNANEVSSADLGIAIVGMAGRFPGATTVDAFWKNLRDGVESISFFSDQELTDGIAAELLKHADFVPAGAVLSDVEMFDAAFFGYTPREAQIIDPQQRLFLECAWEALEAAGYEADSHGGRVGVYAGVSRSSYLEHAGTDYGRFTTGIQAVLSTDKDFLAARVAYKMNLEGPAVVIQTACSTSLVAVHIACQSLLAGECDIALAGGVCINVPQKTGYLYQEEGILSRDGHCRPFDAGANGTVPGSGAGIVVLKRLADALADGDSIDAVIKGSAINNDGARKVGFTAPRVEGQVKVIRAAMLAAEVDAETIGYIEAHGTATPVGDPIEFAALQQAFEGAPGAKGSCVIGSVKSNIGHLDAAAGVAGLIKTVLSLQHKALPPTLHFQKSNPRMDLASSRFMVSSTPSEWKTDGVPRRAGVSAFGIGGTNVHVVVEEAPDAVASAKAKPHQLLVLSAKTETALEKATDNLAAHLRTRTDSNLADVAYTLRRGRKTFDHRRAVVCSDPTDAAAALETRDSRQVFTAAHEPSHSQVAFLFPGQGSQYVQMGRGLYDSEIAFRAQVDACCDLLRPLLGWDLRSELYPTPERETAAAGRLQQAGAAQPALFVVEYALAKLWESWGVVPQAMIGHSVGEYVAACLAGVFSLEDALRLVVERCRLMEACPVGAMLAVPRAEHELGSALNHRLWLAAVNAPAFCVVSGPIDDVERLKIILNKEGLTCRRLLTSHAFHSEMMEPAQRPFAERVAQIKLHAPRTPYISNLTGMWIRPEEATDPTYWARHLRETVRFSAGMGVLLADPSRILLEVGPGHSLTSFTKLHLDTSSTQIVVPSSRHAADPQPDGIALLSAAARLWLGGIDVDWTNSQPTEMRRRVRLPTYPFERQRYWLGSSPADRGSVAAQDRLHKRAEISDWFYVPSWKRTSPAPRFQSDSLADHRSCWCLLEDAGGLGKALADRLRHIGEDIVTVRAAKQFSRQGDRCFTVDPRNRDHFDALFDDLRTQGVIPGRILHCWSEDAPVELAPSGVEPCLDLCFHSLIHLAQALGKQNAARVFIGVVTSGAQDVTGGELTCPIKATVIGPCRVIPAEYAGISCRHIDILCRPSVGWPTHALDQIINEACYESGDSLVAYRGRYRWTQAFEPVHLAPPLKLPQRLRERGVYLVTGGLGGIGLELAEYLAQLVRARLILVGRTALPPRTEWDAYVDSHGDEDPVGRRIRKLLAVEGFGGEVMVAAADVADFRQMRQVIAEAERRFGAIHGIIHAAGIAGGGMIHLKTDQAASAVLAPKVTGTLVLDSLFQGKKLDFLVLCSSAMSVIGSLGRVDYTSANAFLDAIAHSQGDESRFTVSVNWGDWKEIGMAAHSNRSAGLQAQREELLGLGMTSQEGLEAFRRVLDITFPQVVVSTFDLTLMRAWKEASVTPEAPAEQVAPPPTQQHARPKLQNDYVAPRKDLERAIAALWQRLLGIESVGVRDNFFELGGDSLLALQVVSRLKSEHGLAITPVILYESPTIEALVRQFSDGRPDDASSADHRGEARIRSLEQRRRL